MLLGKGYLTKEYLYKSLTFVSCGGKGAYRYNSLTLAYILFLNCAPLASRVPI